MAKPHIIIISIFVTISCNVFAIPFHNFDPEPPKPSTLEFDYLPEADCSASDTKRPKYNAIMGDKYRWSGFFVKPDPQNTENETAIINDAMYQLMEVLPCVKFGIYKKDDVPEVDYIHIKRVAKGCETGIGRHGGEQIMKLGDECWTVGTVLHEMCHALGLHHENNRPDRDEYVTIRYENVLENMKDRLEKLSSNVWETFGVPYDYQSIMHEKGTAFSKNGKPTIIAKTGEPVGRKGHLQDSDIIKLRAMYNCEW